MANGVEDKEIIFKEMLVESYLCKYDPGLVIFKHDKFFLSRDVTTGIIFAHCSKCDATYQIREGSLVLKEKSE